MQAGHCDGAILHLPAMPDQAKIIDVLSSVLHPSVSDVLSGFLPGLFFESCIVMAGPQNQVQLLIGRASLDRYTPALIALLMAFVVGSAFMLWVRLLHTVLRYAAIFFR